MLEGQIIGTVSDTPQAHPGSAGVSFTVGVGDGLFELTVTHALAHTARLLKAGTTVLIDLAAQDGRLEVRHIEILGTGAPRNSFRVSGAMIWADSPTEGATLTVPGLGEVRLIATGLSALGFTGDVYALGQLYPMPAGWTFRANRLEGAEGGGTNLQLAY